MRAPSRPEASARTYPISIPGDDVTMAVATSTAATTGNSFSGAIPPPPGSIPRPPSKGSTAASAGPEPDTKLVEETRQQILSLIHI